MNLAELSSSYSLQPVVTEIVRKVKEVSGKDIDFRISNTISVYAVTKIARKRMSQHVIYFRKDVVDRLSYIIAHECGHILRIMEAPEEERVVPATNKATKLKVLEDIKSNSFSKPLLAKMIGVWVDGIVMQVTNLPVDVRIERWIQKSFPSLKQEQISALEKDAEKTLAGLSKEVEMVTPTKIFAISNSMAYAYLRGIGPIVGKRYDKAFYGRNSILNLGKKLYKFLEEEDRGYSGDIETINLWAKTLGIDGWFDWISFESMPESYYEDL